MTTLIFPIGHYMGALYPGTSAPLHSHGVRIGTSPIRLSDDEFGVWRCGHGVVERALEVPWTRRRLLAAARNNGIADPRTIVDDLLDDEILAEVTPGTPAAVGFARQYRVRPLKFGLGNSPKHPELFGIGIEGHTAVTVPDSVFAFWRWGHRPENLWEAAKGYGWAFRDSGAPEEESDPEAMLGAILCLLHALLASNAIYLDLA